MAAQAWKIYGIAKRKLGNNTAGIRLDSGIFKMSLHRSAATANITDLTGITTFGSILNEISSRGGYPTSGSTGGNSLPPAAGQWTQGASNEQMKWTYTTAGIVFTASNSDLINIKFACIHYSSGAVNSGFPLCYASLSSAQFTISSPNTLTVLPAATGVFTLA